MHQVTSRLKRAELTSAVGAGVLGAGVGLVFDRVLRPHAVAILLLGLLMHGWGMYDKHRLETALATVRPRWTEWLYWGCWLALLGLGVFIGLR
jgi:hypothetical protein